MTMENQPLKDIVVIYHAHCPDGMASAWCAWKKFGESATYLPCSDRKNPPEGLIDKEVYILDFSYPREVLKDLDQKNKKLVILDHHISTKDDVLSVQGGVFNIEKSGAGLSWEYFCGGEMPKLLVHIQSKDIGLKLDEDTELSERVIATPFTFQDYEEIITKFEHDAEKVIQEGKIINLFTKQIFDMVLEDYEMITFEGHTMPSINITLPLTTKSQALTLLYRKIPPIAMAYRYENGFWKISLRSDGSVDCSALASKYGGGGHKGSAGFAVSAELPLPFAKVVEKKEV